jgi:peptidoglycan/xylan/chitin deacetylase (PgdA/CDA1 family)
MVKDCLTFSNIPEILSVCDQYSIPITWLTVGHLFLDSCLKVNNIKHPDIPNIEHFENNWWRYTGKSWFEHDPCSNYHSEPLWYSPDLIELIVNSKVEHEIGCHTFSHIDCRKEVCSPSLLRAEISACQRAAQRFGIDKMESFVHPGHTIGNLDTLADLGYTNFRTDHANILGYPKKHANGLWEFTTTLELNYQENWSVSSQINRYISTFKRAIRNHSVAYLWFHPSFDAAFVEHIMPPVFDWLDKHRNEIWIVTKGEYVRWLNEKHEKD